MPAPFQTKIILGGIIVLLMVTMYYTFSEVGTLKSPVSTKPTACTADAMRCPDGSYVGRVGPKCEFAACPSGASSGGTSGDTQQPAPSPTSTTKQTSAEGSVKFGQTAQIAKVNITPQSIVEDSRCGADVQCVQAGTVRIKAQVDTGSGKTNVTVGLGVPTTVGANTITLIGVYPPRKSGVSISSSEYLLTFHVVSQ